MTLMTQKVPSFILGRHSRRQHLLNIVWHGRCVVWRRLRLVVDLLLVYRAGPAAGYERKSSIEEQLRLTSTCLRSRRYPPSRHLARHV